jgi:hypothetical protein
MLPANAYGAAVQGVKIEKLKSPMKFRKKDQVTFMFRVKFCHG